MWSLLLLTVSVGAFQAPLPFLAKPSASIAATAAAGPLSSLFVTTPSLRVIGSVSDTVPALPVVATTNSFLMAEGALDVVRNIALGITAILFFLFGLTFLYASFIIPQAAQELEKECKELDPQLWEQYSAKLGEGETMATRPDLMQELGVKLQPLLEAKILAQSQQQGGDGGMPSPLETTMNPFSNSAGSSQSKEDEGPSIVTTSPDQWDSNDDVIDVTIEKKVTDTNDDKSNEKK